MADITYNFSVGKTWKQRLRVLASVIRAMWTGKFVIQTPDLQPGVEPMDFSEANFKEIKRQRNHFANQNALLRQKLASYGGSHASHTTTMSDKDRSEIDAVFEQVDKAFEAADKLWPKYGNRIIRKKYD